MIPKQADTSLTIALKWGILIPMKYLYTYPHFFPSINILSVSSVIWWQKLQLADYLSLAHFFCFL
jgi:hypothetical protein